MLPPESELWLDDYTVFKYQLSKDDFWDTDTRRDPFYRGFWVSAHSKKTIILMLKGIPFGKY